MHIFSQVKEFVDEFWDQKSPLLLGYSGGPDSKALLYLLLEAGVRPHLAHVDHGWREESALEALTLKEEAEKLGLVFHSVRLEPDRRESCAREKRLAFFASLFQKIPFQALVLAHQADDRSETALKRVLEGAHLVHLSGLNKVSFLHGMAIWRPLLSTSRSEVLSYVKEKDLKPFYDPTNRDSTYLRARMREEILPFLSRSFGKKVSENLHLLASRSYELKAYFDKKTEGSLALLKKGPWGYVLPPSNLEDLEMRHLLQRLGISFSRRELDILVQALQKKTANLKVGSKFLADRGYFFYFSNPFPSLIEKIPLQEGVFVSANWHIEITAQKEPFRFAPPSWLDLFCADFSLFVPRLDGVLYMSAVYLSFFRKKWNQKKIPSFLRAYLPCLERQEKPPLDLFHLSYLEEGFRIRFSMIPTSLKSTK